MIFTLELKLGIAGTAKNTGKTTVTAAVMNELRRRGVPFYLTSIGYDGENIDNVTGLPKPKLPVESGDVVATAEKCLLASTARFSVLAETAVRTPLGKVKVVRVTEPGLVVTAGPKKSSEVQAITEILSELGPGITLVDGALNRIVPMSETDCFILATGAARSLDIPRLAKETECIRRIADLPLAPHSSAIRSQNLNNVSLLDDTGMLLAATSYTSLLSENDAAVTLHEAEETNAACLYVPGIISERATHFMLSAKHRRYLPRFLAVPNPIKLLAFGNAIEYLEDLEHLADAGMSTGVVRRIPMLAVTVNPFYPEFRYESASYQPAYIDPLRLYLTMKATVSAPVYNIMRQGTDELIELILSSQKTWNSPQMIQMAASVI